MSIQEKPSSFLYTLEKVIASRAGQMQANSYTAKLIQKGHDKILQKVGEESVEYIIDAKNKNKERAISEACDLLYHLMVSFYTLGISFDEIEAELEKRHLK